MMVDERPVEKHFCGVAGIDEERGVDLIVDSELRFGKGAIGLDRDLRSGWGERARGSKRHREFPVVDLDRRAREERISENPIDAKDAVGRAAEVQSRNDDIAQMRASDA